MAPPPVLPSRGRAERLWLGFVFFLPLAFCPLLNDTFALAKATLLRCGCAFFLVVCAGAAARAGGIRLRRSSLNLPLAAFLAAAFASLLGADFKSAAFWGLAGDFSDGWMSLLCFLFLFWFASSQLSDEQAAKTLRAMSGAAVAAALYGLLQAAGFDVFVWRTGQGDFVRPWSTLGNPNFLGAFLAMSLPLALEALLKRPTPAWTAGAAIVLAVLPFTLSQAAGLAALAGAALWVWWRRGPLRGKILILARVPLLAGVVIIGLLAWRGRDHARPAASLAEQALAKASSAGSSVRGRLLLWRTAARMAAAHPVLGIGPAGFAYHFKRWMDPEFRTVASPGLSSSHAHNEILNTAASLGLAGLAVYGWIIYRLAALMARFYRDEAGDRGSAAAGIAASLAAVWVNNQFSFHTVATAAYACVLMGLLARRQTPDHVLPLGPAARTGVRAAAYAAGAAGFALSVSFLAANRFNRLSEDAYRKRGDWRKAISLGKTASRLDPFSSAYHIVLGRLMQEGILQGWTVEESRSFFQDSVDQYERVARLTPLNALAQRGLGVDFMQAARRFQEPAYLDQAEQRFKLALAADPYDASTHLNLGDLYAQQGLESKAVSEWQRALMYDSNNEEAKQRLSQTGDE